LPSLLLSACAAKVARAYPAGVDANGELLRWYRPRRAAYPWRRGSPDPYRVLVSEVMLQQTQAPRVAAAFGPFLARFPSIAALAAAPRSDVVRAWGALGYNRRAARLHEAARATVREHGGRLPSDPSQLGALPGVGPYTASAVASIAFGVPVAAVDTNVRRVAARFLFGANPEGVERARLREAIDGWLHRRQPGAWNQAVMDLGRLVCRPAPRCDACPLAAGCRFRASSRPRPMGRSQPAFRGSSRELRGAIVRHLRSSTSATLSAIASRTGRPLVDVASAVRALDRDGLVQAGPAALAGRPAGRLRLADEPRSGIVPTGTS
jgi:A/G-specific adenine glycosylase